MLLGRSEHYWNLQILNNNYGFRANSQPNALEFNHRSLYDLSLLEVDGRLIL